jgi:hypothetical protein
MTREVLMMMARVMAAAMTAALVVALSASPVLAQSKKEGASKRQATAGQLAARERAKKCGAEWQEAKAAGKVESGMKWPKFWSACNKRLKAARA